MLQGSVGKVLESSVSGSFKSSEHLQFHNWKFDS